MISALEISQLLMVGVPDNADLSHLRELAPGGVVLFARNAGTPAEVRRLTRRIQETVKAGGATSPTLVAVDQEGGRVQRLVDGFSLLPPCATWRNRAQAPCGWLQ
jgi:beta-N-acetylhexosaminidase